MYSTPMDERYTYILKEDSSELFTLYKHTIIIIIYININVIILIIHIITSHHTCNNLVNHAELLGT